MEKKKYIIVNEGTDFRRIAKIMSAGGMKMNHATARNQLMIALENLFAQLANQIGIKLDKKQIATLIHQQSVHDLLGEVFWKAFNTKKEKANKSTKLGNKTNGSNNS